MTQITPKRSLSPTDEWACTAQDARRCFTQESCRKRDRSDEIPIKFRLGTCCGQVRFATSRPRWQFPKRTGPLCPTMNFQSWELRVENWRLTGPWTVNFQNVFRVYHYRAFLVYRLLLDLVHTRWFHFCCYYYHYCYYHYFYWTQSRENYF